MGGETLGPHPWEEDQREAGAPDFSCSPSKVAQFSKQILSSWRPLSISTPNPLQLSPPLCFSPSSPPEAQVEAPVIPWTRGLLLLGLLLSVSVSLKNQNFPSGSL